MATKATVLALFGDAARGVVVAMLCSISLAGAQTVAPLKLTVPKEHPRIGITAADLDRVRGTMNKEPWAGLWKAHPREVRVGAARAARSARGPSAALAVRACVSP